MITVLLAALFYITYLYFFKEQTPDPFQLRENCTGNEIVKGTEKATLFFEQYANRMLERNLKGKNQSNSCYALTEDAYREAYLFNRTTLAYLNDSILLCECLNKSAQLNAQLLKKELQTAVEAYAYRHYKYPVNVYDGVQDQLLNILVDYSIKSRAEAQRYIAKIEEAKEQLDCLIMHLKTSAAKGYILPKQLFPEVLAAVQDKMAQESIQKEGGNESIYTDFYRKIKQLNLPEDEQKALENQLLTALNNYWFPAYQQLYNYLKELEKEATEDIGAWRLEEGMNFYAYKLKEQTTTSLTVDEIFQLGKDEVARIHNEIEGLMKELSYEGDLAAFFEFLQTNQQFYDLDSGEGVYLEKVEATIKNFEPELEKVTLLKPTAQLLIEKGEQTFYQMTAIDSSNIGVYTVNTANLNQLPKYELDALTYSNTIPGAHLQTAIEWELVDLAKFRQLGASCKAYQEGWKLYAAYLPKELGYYQNTYADIGRLTNELWWTCALVVDIGIHCYEWKQSEAIAYYQKNTPTIKTSCTQMVNQQIVNPAQATAAKLGMITFLELRRKAKETLGEKFSLEAFHDVLLMHGAVPLDVLQDLTDDYIDTRLALDLSQ